MCAITHITVNDEGSCFVFVVNEREIQLQATITPILHDLQTMIFSTNLLLYEIFPYSSGRNGQIERSLDDSKFPSRDVLV